MENIQISLYICIYLYLVDINIENIDTHIDYSLCLQMNRKEILLSKVKITLESQLFRDCEALQELHFVKNKMTFSPVYSLR